jgi:hypothetical protein
MTSLWTMPISNRLDLSWGDMYGSDPHVRVEVEGTCYFKGTQTLVE